jgi:flagellar hook-associated protein 1 FlgK
LTLTGTLKGLIDMRDGNNGIATADKEGEVISTDPANPTDPADYAKTTNYKGIPFYMNKLNILCRTFARAINEGLDVEGNPIQDDAMEGGEMVGHMYGYDKDGQDPCGILLYTALNGKEDLLDPTDPLTWMGGNMGAGGRIDYSELNCMNIAVNPVLEEDPYRLATNSSPTSGESNNDVIHGFTKINSYASLFKEGKLLDFIIGTSDHLAIDHRQALNFETSYEEITMATNNQRLSVSGVSLNEEMMAMIKYQQLFMSCSRMVNVIDSIYDTMINRLGAF